MSYWNRYREKLSRYIAEIDTWFNTEECLHSVVIQMLSRRGGSAKYKQVDRERFDYKVTFY